MVRTLGPAELLAHPRARHCAGGAMGQSLLALVRASLTAMLWDPWLEQTSGVMESNPHPSAARASPSPWHHMSMALNPPRGGDCTTAPGSWLQGSTTPLSQAVARQCPPNTLVPQKPECQRSLAPAAAQQGAGAQQ